MKTLQKALLPLTLAFTLTACGDSPDELARKPALVQQMVENSASICETGPVHGDNAAYEERLGAVLMRARMSSLETLKDANVTICLDQRLSAQDWGIWNGRLDGVFYGQKNGGVAALWDDGQQPSEASIWSMNAYYRGYGAVNNLAYQASQGRLAAEGGYLGAFEYGKSHSVSWSSRDPAAGTLGKNPQLRTPPLKSAAPKPVS